MERNQNKDVIDLKAVFQTIWQQRRTFYRVLPVVFVLSCIWIFPQPRYYTASVKLAPEFAGDMEAGGLSSIASSFGVNVNMVALKLAEMKKAGLPLNLPFTPDRRFLGRIEDRPDSV